MYYRYDEISVMTKAHLAELKYDQECCARGRNMKRASQKLKEKMNALILLLSPKHLG